MDEMMEYVDDAFLAACVVFSHREHPVDGVKLGESLRVAGDLAKHHDFYTTFAGKLYHELLTKPRFPELEEVD